MEEMCETWLLQITPEEEEGIEKEKEGDRHPARMRSPPQLFSRGCPYTAPRLSMAAPLHTVSVHLARSQCIVDNR